MKRTFFSLALLALVILTVIMILQASDDAVSLNRANVQQSPRALIADENATPVNGDVAIDARDSVIQWTGHAIGKERTGTIAVKEGVFDMNGTTITRARVVIDMDSMKNTDLDQRARSKLVSHLMNGDFFIANDYSDATLLIKKIERMENTDREKMTADLTIKNITREVVFYGRTPIENNRVKIDADAAIDRTMWNASYRSENPINGTRTQAIDDTIMFKLSIVSEPLK